MAKETNVRVYLIMALRVFGGLRRDEIFDQRLEEIDFERKTLTVSNKKEDTTKYIQDFQTKSGKNRTLPLMSRLAEILEPYRKPDGYIVEPAKGETLGRFRHPRSSSRIAVGVQQGCVLGISSGQSFGGLHHRYERRAA